MAKRRKRPAEVFLSHAGEDREFAVRFAAELRRHGVKVWYFERHIQGADQWYDEIGEALQRCDWFILVLSPQAMRSKWVKNELLYALGDDKFDECIMPVAHRKCTAKELKKFAWSLLPRYQVVGQPGDFDGTLKLILRRWAVAYRPTK